MVLVSVVVVVTGLRTVVSWEVLVVLCEADPLSELQPISVTTAAARHGRMSFFICVIVLFVVLIVTLPHEITLSVGHTQWGITLP